MSDQTTIVKGCTNIDQLIQLTNSSSNDKFRMAFFYNPPEDSQFYYITFELLKENIDHDSDHTIYYKLDDNNFYQVSCRLISRSLIVQFLNKKIYGIEIRQGEEPQQDYLTFSNSQRDNLEFHLKDFLSNRFAQKQINKNPNVNKVNIDNKVIAYPKL
jgi:hypothetical protein